MEATGAETDEFSRAIAALYPSLLRYARRIARNGADVEDLARCYRAWLAPGGPDRSGTTVSQHHEPHADRPRELGRFEPPIEALHVVLVVHGPVAPEDLQPLDDFLLGAFFIGQ